MKVQFHDLNEFLKELGKDAERVDRRIVRITRLYRRHSQFPVRALSVVATAVVGGHLLRLDLHIGEVMSPDIGDNSRLD